jgi:hypothetical protein
MPAETKAVNLTEDEIKTLIANHGNQIYDDDSRDENVERINYLNKRLKAFKEESKPETKPADVTTINQGWGQTNG